MNTLLLIAALLCFLLGVAHSVLGEKYVIGKIAKANLSLRGDTVYMRRIVWLAWHITSVMFVGFGLVLLNMSFGLHALVGDRTIIAVIFLVSAVISLVSTRGRHASWFIFGAIALLTFVSGPRT